MPGHRVRSWGGDSNGQRPRFLNPPSDESIAGFVGYQASILALLSLSFLLYHRPGSCPDCIIAAFCSWKRCPNLSDPLRYLSTHFITQLSSFDWRDFVVKSFTQSSKHLWTSLEYIWLQTISKAQEKVKGLKMPGCARAKGTEWDQTHSHELFHLLLFHPTLQLTLLLCIESGRKDNVSRIFSDIRHLGTHPSILLFPL